MPTFSQKHTELFYMLKDVLATIKQRDLTYSDVLYHELNMLQILGFEPNFQTCVYCGKAMDELLPPKPRTGTALYS